MHSPKLDGSLIQIQLTDPLPQATMLRPVNKHSADRLQKNLLILLAENSIAVIFLFLNLHSLIFKFILLLFSWKVSLKSKQYFYILFDIYH